ncbi:MAG: imidazole glycerol phosphate synthase subunit HisH, partial [Planctomycetaceae bacterium]|nr:imidazole glycerol phosphate synthase subunit HisH [Planctomycetaceae bacterium]
MITIVDYGMGNLRSVQKAFERLQISAEISQSPTEIGQAEKLVLPGVGAFRDAISELKTKQMVAPVCDHIAAGKPFLGICLGLQLLFDVSYEDGEWEGLGVVPGEVKRLEDQPGLKIPHMGWNQIHLANHMPMVLKDIPPGSHFYFVHSYHVVPKDVNYVATRTTHGESFVSMIAKDNLFATQF